MANHKSAAKRARQTVKRTERNRAVKAEVKTAVRAFREALTEKDADKAKVALAHAARLIRKSASKGVTQARAASRRVSRLATSFNKLAAAK